ncbi:TetR/AcrR family transcriptional regulator [Streptomyces sp. B21-083]|uniref:TetR/AcrR family transcriptional regulator n=1 Tax=Streptomyces sp. B21-083 TaxID=3039410 RepID=UPI002FEF41DC
MATAATGTETSRKQRAEASRRRLVEAAAEQFLSRPYEEVAIGDIAELAGVTPGLLYHYFENKRGIYLEAMREAGRRLRAAHQPHSDAPPGEQVRELLRTHLSYMSEHQEMALGLIHGGIGADPEARAIFQEDRRRTIGWLCDALGLDAQNPAVRLTLRAAVGATDEATVFWIEQGRPFGIPELVEALMEMLIAAIEGAARLDPDLRAEQAVALLRRSER